MNTIVTTYHPELMPGEVLFCNAFSKEQVNSTISNFKTARVGNQAYYANSLIPIREEAYPIFIKVTEALEKKYMITRVYGGYVSIVITDDHMREKLRQDTFSMDTEKGNIPTIWEIFLTGDKATKKAITRDFLIAIGVFAVGFVIAVWFTVLFINYFYHSEWQLIWPFK